MSLPDEYFYHGSMKRYTLLFGSLFNNIKIARFEGDSFDVQDIDFIRVPIKHQPGFMSVDDDREADEIKTQMILPQMTYVMGSPAPDEEGGATGNAIIHNDVVGVDGNRRIGTMKPIPYTFPFTLSIRTKTKNDLNQIVEQILPYFAPQMSVGIIDTPQGLDAYKERSVDLRTNILINLDTSSIDDEINESMDTQTYYTADLEFTLHGNLYKIMIDHPIIRRIVIKDGETIIVDESGDPFIDEFDTMSDSIENQDHRLGVK